MPGTQNAPNSIGALIKKRAPLQPSVTDHSPQPVPRPAPQPPKTSGKFILTCWDGDIYILQGYESVEDIHNRIMGLDWVRMPNGSQIKASSIAKIQSYEDYEFQKDQQWRHKRGQYLSGRNQDKWWHNADGYIRDATEIAAITGKIDAPALPQSTEKPIALEEGKR